MRRTKSIMPIFLSITLFITACSQTMTPSSTITTIPTAITMSSPSTIDTLVPTLVPTITPTSLPWKLVWSDEFDGTVGTSPDSKNWTYDIGGDGWGNSEHEYYTNSTANVSLDGKGSLVIIANKADSTTVGNQNCWYGPCEYTSARILTKGLYEFTYGKVEARLKIPSGQGMWPAFWMLGADVDMIGWPGCGEVDIMENLGREPSLVHGSVHGPAISYSGTDISNGYAYMLENGNFSDDFHVYGIEWETDAIRWYVDDNIYYSVNLKDFDRAKWVYDHPFFIILNVAVGGGWPGLPDETTVFPQYMIVDYVRVYQH